MQGLTPEQRRVLEAWPRGKLVSRGELTRHAVSPQTIASLVRRGWVIEVGCWRYRRRQRDPEPDPPLSPEMERCRRWISAHGGRITRRDMDLYAFQVKTVRALQRRGLLRPTREPGVWLQA